MCQYTRLCEAKSCANRDAARPYWKPSVKEIFPLKSLIFLAGAYANCKLQLVMLAQKMQKEAILSHDTSVVELLPFIE